MVGNHGSERDVPLDMNTVRHLTLAAATLVALTLATACGDVVPGTGDPPDELTGDWLLIDGHGPEGPIPIVEGNDITLSIDEDAERWSGTAACNSYDATTVEVTGDALRITELLQTEMACPGEGVMESEQAYLTAFGQVTGFTVDGDELTLHGDDVRLAFERRPPEPEAYAVGVAWRVQSLLDGAGPDGTANEAVEDPYLLLHDDGTVELDTACISYLGTYDFDGETLTVDQLAQDRAGADRDGDLACAYPVGTQHEHILEVFSSPVEVDLDGNTMWLMNGDGAGLDLRAEG